MAVAAAPHGRLTRIAFALRFALRPGSVPGMTQTTGQHSYTWEQIADLTGYSADDLRQLTSDWVTWPGYLDQQDQPTEATLVLLEEQMRIDRLADDPHADDPTYDSDFYEDN